MHLYDSRVGELIQRATSGQIADALSCNFLHRMDLHASHSEVKSWKNSLGAFAEAVNGAGLDESWIVLEYHVPPSSARMDAMLLGQDKAAKRNAVVMEFKQWDSCEAYCASGEDRLGGQEKLHPSAQQLSLHVPGGERFGAVEGEEGTAARSRVDRVDEVGLDAGGLVEEGKARRVFRPSGRPWAYF